jgi:hypothetical protein
MTSWVPKSDAPPVFNLADEFLALVTGDTTWGWLQPFIYEIAGPIFSTADFCAKGPPSPPMEPLSLADFLMPTIGPNRLADKLTRIAYDRIFGAFCQGPASGDPSEYGANTCSAIFSDHGSFGQDREHVLVVIPAGAVHCIPSIQSLTAGLAVLEWRANADGTGAGSGCTNGTAIGDDSAKVIPTGMHSITCWLDGGPGSGVVCARFDGGAGSPIVHTPTPQPPVIGALAPTIGTYGSIPDLGAELDHLEDKLDQLRQSVAFIIQNIAAPSLAVDDTLPTDPVPVGPGIPKPDKAVAAVVSLSAIPANASELFADPPKYARLGTITLGTARGWLPSFPLEHNPQLIAPLPPYVTEVRVFAFPPAVATLSFLTAL